MSAKWILNSGLHRGDVMSRDSGSEECESLEDCKRRFAEQERNWNRMGYQVWYAVAIGPDGEQVRLSDGTPYRR